MDDREFLITDFWCDKCRLDWRLRAEKIKRGKRLFWVCRCPKCRSEMLRYADDPRGDPYYQNSERMKREARKYARDLLQPDDPLFDVVYPWHKKQREELKALEEKRKWELEQKKKK